MTRPDAYRAYALGASAVALGDASEALATAFTTLIQIEDLDGPLMSAISRAQTETKAAQQLRADVSWHTTDAHASASGEELS